MTEKLPLVVQETNAPTRKLVAGVSAGLAFAVTLIPMIFPMVTQIIETIDPLFAAQWGPTIAAIVSAILTVFGGGSVSWVVKNRATPVQVKEATDAMKDAATTAAIKVVSDILADKR